MNDIHREPLGSGMEIYVSKTHRFSTGTILLADFSLPTGKKYCADLGAGCGTIPLLWLKKNPTLTVAAVELQEDACALLRDSIACNRLSDRLTVVNADLKALKGILPFGAFDTVSCNPPYKLGGTGVLNPDEAKLTARHETACTLDDICESAAKLLRFGGRFCVCQRPERLADVMESMRRADIEPKRLRLVQQRPGKAPKLFLLEGRRSGRRGYMDVLPTLFIEDGQGGWSAEMLAIYDDYKTR